MPSMITHSQVTLDSMRWLSHRRCPSPPGRHAMVSSVAACYVLRAPYGLATAHALLCTVSGDDSAVFCFFLSLVTLTLDFDLRTRARFLYSVPNAKFDRPTCSRSEVIMQTNILTNTNTLTNKQSPLKKSTSLRYSTPVGNNTHELCLTGSD